MTDTTSASPPTPKRRYLALVARAKDQAGTPEGHLCKRLAATMAERWPELLDTDEVQPTSMFELRWKKWFEKELLLRAVRYFGCEPLGWSGRKSQTKAVLFETGATTAALIEHAFVSQKEQLFKVISWAMGGYFSGAMPLPSSDDDSPEEEDLDPEMLELALAAMRLGRRGRPLQALGSGS